MNEILIYSDIGENYAGDGATASVIKSQLEEFKGDVTVRINSGGGDVFEGFAIYNLLTQHEGKTKVIIDGLAASAASVIAMAGDEVVMAENSLMMIHDPWTMALGDAEDMRATASLLDKIKDSIVTTYKNKTGIDSETISSMMKEETWLNSSEAIGQGFATITAEATKSISNIAKPWIKNAPKPSDLATIPEIEEEITEDIIQKETAWRLAANKRKISILERERSIKGNI